MKESIRAASLLSITEMLKRAVDAAFMTNVFISYSRKDRVFVESLQAALSARGKTSWVDWEGIPPSAEWIKEIHAAIDAAEV